jgi:sucrose-6-phosphate hydrolase SacC (GH32 family)
LSVDEQGALRQMPAPEVEGLRQTGLHVSDIALGAYALAGLEGEALDIQARLRGEPRASYGLKLVPLNEHAETITLTSSTTEIRLNDKRLSFQRDPEAELDLRLLLDRSVVEVFINSQASLTLVLPPIPSRYRVELFSQDGHAQVLQLDAWPMSEAGPAEPAPDRNSP